MELEGREVNRSTGAFPKVPSLLFDIELEEDRCSAAHRPADDPDSPEILQLLRPGSSHEELLRLHVSLALQQCRFSGNLFRDNQMLASALEQKAYNVKIRTALGGGQGMDCLKNLRHTFLTISISGRTFICDLAFKEQFTIAKPSSKYTALLDCLPSVLVVEEPVVCHIVQIMCCEMATAFEQFGSVVPPWRRVESMLSKWLPRKLQDDRVSSLRPDRPLSSARIEAGGRPAQKNADKIERMGPRISDQLHGICRVGPTLLKGSGSTCRKVPSFEPHFVMVGGNFTSVN